MTKFSQMEYERPDLEEIKKGQKRFTARLEAAQDYPAAREIFLEHEQAEKHLQTSVTLASIRHSIDTGDEFYDREIQYWNGALPELQEDQQAWTDAMLSSPWRADFSAEFGDLMFVNAEMERKTFSPDIIPQLQKENELTEEYEKLLASAQVPFRGSTYTLAQMSPFKSDPDDQTRKEAWTAEGVWYKEHQDQLDDLYDQLVRLRDQMGKILGYEGYTTLGYYRMGRNCYTSEDVAVFRGAVRKYLVPVVDQIYRAQADRLGMAYPMSFSDQPLVFRSGNPKPFGTPDQILMQGKKFYEELSPETGEFFRMMLEGELLDVLSRKNKASGGYTACIADYNVPFIFANFNGTKDDVEVMTHEAGHAFAGWLNRDRIPQEYIWPSMEGCEVHSMSMEFFAEPWAEDFFGKDAGKYRYSHLLSALSFIPYGTMVDHFQHEVYADPNLTPSQRHEIWKNLLSEYMPWLRLDGEIPFYSEGEGWQRQHHIYSSPFYYIDYCLAQTVALEFWAKIQEDRKEAWDCYLAYSIQGGSRTFTDLLEKAGLDSPFDENCLRRVCRTAAEWLSRFEIKEID